MKAVIYSAHEFEKNYLEEAFRGKHEVKYIRAPLSLDTAALAKGAAAVSIFVNDNASGPVLQALSGIGVKFLLLRSAGFNHVDLEQAKKLGMKAARVPDYSPFAVAEHAIALILALNRKLIPAHNKIMEQNFSLDGQAGFDMNGKTVGIIGTGKIGSVMAKILHGFGCRILAFDKMPDEKLKELYNVKYTTLDDLYAESDIITLHLPLTPETEYMIQENSLKKMKKGIMLINTGRGRLIKTTDVIKSLKSKHIGSLGLDVYEGEEGLFFEDHSGEILQDDLIARLMTFKNVLITGHQAFLTETALKNIAETTVYNLTCFEEGKSNKNSLI